MSGSDLLIRETILGVIKSRDLNNEGIIHTSDFRSAVADLGFPFGHPIIENILVHCVIMPDGFVDFNGLERELARERRVTNAKASAIPSGRVKTSTGTALKPWRADVVHQQKMQSERQAKLLQEKHNDVFDAFRKYEEQVHSEEELINCIKDLGIVPTRSFLELLRTNRSCEIRFGDFVRSLIHYDPNSKPLDYSRPAGGAASLMGRNDMKDREEHQAGLFYARKRVDYQKKTAMQSSAMERKTGKKIIETDATMRSRGGSKGSGGQAAQRSTIGSFVKSSRGVQDAMVHDNAPGTPLLSAAQLEMHKGKKGVQKQELSYTSEQKLLREQVLAALRKLDAGELSRIEFQDIIFTMGIELPEGVLKQLQLQEQSGLLDWRACVHELDGYVFKHRSLEDDTPHEAVAVAKQRLKDSVERSGSLDALSLLLQMFHRVDENGDKLLSFNEFRKACRDFLQDTQTSKGLSDSDIRYLFNHFDKNGDGSLSYDEVISSLQGDVSPRRKDIIRQAFVMMDRFGTGKITLEVFLDHFNVNHYPDVATGRKSPWQALRQIEDFFEICSMSGRGFETAISASDFEMFFKNLSPHVANDDDFFKLVRDMTGLSSKKPAVQCREQQSGTASKVPVAKQSFGDVISWNQEASLLECQSAGRSRQKKAVTPPFPRHPDVISWSEKEGESYDAVDATDGFVLKRSTIGHGSKNLLTWNVQRRQPPSFVHDTPPKYKTKVTVTEDTNSPQEMFSNKNYHWSEGKRNQYAGACPFGTDADSGDTGKYDSYQPGTVKNSKPKSLADVLSSKDK
mmetsp:Transcript_3118/g.4810  ORF Transcript_3118/g.4810 Transcript_3118/m.4810 type:complete len:795 (+) Transcript_3118:89-2473(+)